MHTFCCYTKYPEPIVALDEPPTPFPDIGGSQFDEIGQFLESAQEHLSDEMRAACQLIFSRIFESGGGDIVLPEDDLEASGYSPQAAQSIIEAANRISEADLRKAVAASWQMLEPECYENAEQVVSDMQDIIRTFREAAAKNYGVIIGFA